MREAYDKAFEEHVSDVPPKERETIRDFYSEVVSRFRGQGTNKNATLGFVVVGHMVPTLPFLLEGLRKIGNIAIFVPKGSVNDGSAIEKWLKAVEILCFDADLQKKFFSDQEAQMRSFSSYLAEQASKKEGGDPTFDKWKGGKRSVREIITGNEAHFIDSYCSHYEKVVVIDIGGYFSGLVKCEEPAIKQKVLGYVEDTENGLHKYEAALRKIGKKPNIPPIISVARSEIKDSEDYNVGKAITDATDRILRVNDYTHLAEDKTILIIGYGKVGAAAAKVASEKTRGPVLICEKKPVRKLKASAHSFKVVELADGLRQADVIISCTGQKALTEAYIPALKDHVYISSCTSADDEFHESFLGAIGYRPERSELIEKYQYNNKNINFVNNGRSVNFVEKAVHGYFIHGVLASLLVAAIRVVMASPGEDIIRKGEIVDFNVLRQVNGEKYQNIISEILMRNKLGTTPKLSNYKLARERYIPREGDIKALKRMLHECNFAWVTGGEKAGKSQVVEGFCHSNLGRYDIIWKFYCSSGLQEQFEVFEKNFDEKVYSKDIIMRSVNEASIESFSPGSQHGESQEKRMLRTPQKKRLKHETTIKQSAESIICMLKKAEASCLLVFEDVGESFCASLFLRFAEESNGKVHAVVTSSEEAFGIINRPASAEPHWKIKLEAFPNNKLFEFLSDEKLKETDEKAIRERNTIIGRFKKIFDDEPKKVVTLLSLSALHYKCESDPQKKMLLSGVFANFADFQAGLDYFVDKLDVKPLKLLSVFYVPFELGAKASLIKENTLKKLVSKNEHLFGKDGINILEKKGFIKKDGDFFKPIYENKWSVVMDSGEPSQVLKDFAIRSLLKAVCTYKEENIYYLRVLKIVDEMDAAWRKAYRNWCNMNAILYYGALNRMASYNQREGNFPRALDLLQRVSKEYYNYNDSSKPANPKLAKIISGIAECYLGMVGKDQEAEAQFKIAMEIYNTCKYDEKATEMKGMVDECKKNIAKQIVSQNMSKSLDAAFDSVGYNSVS